jgi:hypothetical protein
VRVIGFLAVWMLIVSEVSAGVIVSDITLIAGIYTQTPAPPHFIQGFISAGTDWDEPVSTGVLNINYRPFLPNTSRVAFDFKESGQNATVDFTWSHSIEGVKDDEAYGYAYVTFRPDMDMRYEISGTYSVDGVAASRQYTEFGSGDLSSFILAHSSKESRSTSNETLVVGSPTGGDFQNNVVGSFTGELKAGQDYSLFNLWYIHAYEDAGPSTATGSLRLSLSPLNAAAVPEPSTLLLMGIGACGVVLRNRKRFRKASAEYQSY